MRFLVGAYVTTVAALVLFAVIGATVVAGSGGSDDPIEDVASEHGYNLLSWELHHFPEKWLYKIGDVFRSNDKPGTDEDVLERYFNLTDEIRTIAADDPDSPDVAPLEEERAWLENTVEDIIEGRITAVLEDQGLTMEPPLFTDIGIVWPPVDFEFDAPPRVLVISPRDHIALEQDHLLTPGIVDSTVESIEDEAEASSDNVSALVVQAGGVATYPSVENNLRTYDSLIDVVSHEWTHQYLAFYPLGFRYFENADTRTLNETVASISGDQLAQLYFERYGHLDLQSDETPSATPSPSPEASPAPTAEPFDFTEEMRALRRQVEAMLADGKIAEAEALMDQKRDEFAAQGYHIRKLNQAYFAFYGFYATGGGSIDPIGPKLQQLFTDSGSVGEFLRRAREIKTRGDLDAALSG